MSLKRNTDLGLPIWFLQIWLNCRWPDPNNPADLQALAERLLEAQRTQPEMNRCSLHQLQQASPFATCKFDRTRTTKCIIFPCADYKSANFLVALDHTQPPNPTHHQHDRISIEAPQRAHSVIAAAAVAPRIFWLSQPNRPNAAPSCPKYFGLLNRPSAGHCLHQGPAGHAH